MIAEVVCGGDVDAGFDGGEEYLLTLERKVFCHLIAQPKTHERILACCPPASLSGIDDALPESLSRLPLCGGDAPVAGKASSTGALGWAAPVFGDVHCVQCDGYPA